MVLECERVHAREDRAAPGADRRYVTAASASATRWAISNASAKPTIVVGLPLAVDQHERRRALDRTWLVIDRVAARAR